MQIIHIEVTEEEYAFLERYYRCYNLATGGNMTFSSMMREELVNSAYGNAQLLETAEGFNIIEP